MTVSHARLRRAVIAAVAFGLLVAVGLGLRGLAGLIPHTDRQLVDDVVAQRTATLTGLAHAASVLGRGAVLIPFCTLVGVALWRWLRWRAWGPLLAVLGADLLQHVIKAIVQRPRPPVVHLEHVTGSSFPSGHATESAAVAMALALLARGRRRPQRHFLTTLLAGLALAVAASRVYLGVHYPTDVAAGVLIGSLWAVIATWCTAR